MDAATKTKAVEKNAAMDRRIGYPQSVKNDSYLNEMYKVRFYAHVCMRERNKVRERDR